LYTQSKKKLPEHSSTDIPEVRHGFKAAKTCFEVTKIEYAAKYSMQKKRVNKTKRFSKKIE
jgi:hypothetical protein